MLARLNIFSQGPVFLVMFTMISQILQAQETAVLCVAYLKVLFQTFLVFFAK